MANNNASESTAKQDHYKVLGLPRTAIAADIRKAYREQALRWHPDKAGEDEEAKARFQAISVAHEILTDPSSRQKYDAELDAEAARQAAAQAEAMRVANRRRRSENAERMRAAEAAAFVNASWKVPSAPSGPSATAEPAPASRSRYGWGFTSAEGGFAAASDPQSRWDQWNVIGATSTSTCTGFRYPHQERNPGDTRHPDQYSSRHAGFPAGYGYGTRIGSNEGGLGHPASAPSSRKPSKEAPASGYPASVPLPRKGSKEPPGPELPRTGVKAGPGGSELPRRGVKAATVEEPVAGQGHQPETVYQSETMSQYSTETLPPGTPKTVKPDSSSNPRRPQSTATAPKPGSPSNARHQTATARAPAASDPSSAGQPRATAKAPNPGSPSAAHTVVRNDSRPTAAELHPEGFDQPEFRASLGDLRALATFHFAGRIWQPQDVRSVEWGRPKDKPRFVRLKFSADFVVPPTGSAARRLPELDLKESAMRKALDAEFKAHLNALTGPSVQTSFNISVGSSSPSGRILPPGSGIPLEFHMGIEGEPSDILGSFERARRNGPALKEKDCPLM